MNTLLPQRRTDELIVKTLDDGVVVYDRRHLRAHSLNPVLAAVWEGCDGARDGAALQALASTLVELPVSPAAVEEALAQLEEAGLLENSIPQPQGSGWTRRELVQVAAVSAAVVVPVIASIVVPTPVHAQSMGGMGSTAGDTGSGTSGSGTGP